MTDQDHIEHPDHAGGDTTDTGEMSVQDAQEVRGRQRQFGKLTPSEAASLRWERERARAKDDEQQAIHEAQGVVVTVRTTVQEGRIIKALEKDALKGDVAASKELRERIKALPRVDEDITALDARRYRDITLLLMDERLWRAYDDGRLAAFLETIETEAIESPDVPTEETEPTA